MATGDKVYLADKQTLDNVNDKIGESTNTASTSGNTLFSILKGLANSISSLSLTNLDATVSSRASSSEVGQISSLVDTDNSASSTGKLSQKLSYIINNMATSAKALSSDIWTSTKAGYLDTNVSSVKLSDARLGYIDRIANGTYGLDKIQALVATNNTANKTGNLSQKLSYVINNGVSSKHRTVTGTFSTYAGSSGYTGSGTGMGVIYITCPNSGNPILTLDGVDIDISKLTYYPTVPMHFSTSWNLKYYYNAGFIVVYYN